MNWSSIAFAALKFKKSQSAARACAQKNSADPMAYAALSAAYLFSEMNRLHVFNKDMFKVEKISGEQAEKSGVEPRLRPGILSERTTETPTLYSLVIATGAEATLQP